jgi:quinol monooxygenase YgiN
MYGTIAKFQVLPGKREEMIRVMTEDDAVTLDGWVADYVYQLDRNSDEFFLVAFFKDKSTYDANANSPAQHQRYLKWRALLASDPEWNDGTVVLANGPKAHR